MTTRRKVTVTSCLIGLSAAAIIVVMVRHTWEFNDFQFVMFGVLWASALVVATRG